MKGLNNYTQYNINLTTFQLLLHVLFTPTQKQIFGQRLSQNFDRQLVLTKVHLVNCAPQQNNKFYIKTVYSTRISLSFQQTEQTVRKVRECKKSIIKAISWAGKQNLVNYCFVLIILFVPLMTGQIRLLPSYAIENDDDPMHTWGKWERNSLSIVAKLVGSKKNSNKKTSLQSVTLIRKCVWRGSSWKLFYPKNGNWNILPKGQFAAKYLKTN